MEFFSGLEQRIDIRVLDIEVLRDARRAGVAGRRVNLGDLRALRQLPSQGVFPAAAAYDEEFYLTSLLS
jgi:hypothetical protein